MKDSNINESFYYLIAFGVSFSSIFITIPISISLTDITILLLLTYAIIFNQKITINLFTFWVILFAIEIFFVNIVNYYLENEFSLSGFLVNYLRILASVLVIFFIPSLTKTFDLVKFNKALLFVIKFHCLIVFFDNFLTYPWIINEHGIALNTGFDDFKRSMGLFAEPSFFAAYTGLMTSLVIQFQVNSKLTIITPFDLVIILLGLISASSLTGILLAVVILFQMVICERDKIFKFTSVVKSAFLIGFSLLIATLFLASSISYLSERLTNLEDGSTLQRMVGSTVLAGQIIEAKPLTGVGLGGKNFRSFVQKSDNSILFDAIETETTGGVALETSSATYWVAILAGGGLPLLIIFYIFVLGSLILNKKTAHVGIMIFIIGVSKGGVFEIALWWTIATVIGYKYFKLPEHIPERI